MISKTSLALMLLLGGAAQEKPAPAGIDAILAETWAERSIRPAPLCDDAEFLRRASLDLIGRVPTMAELEAFRKNPDRAARIDELLKRPEFPRFWSEVWTAMLNGYTPAFESSRDGLRFWLEKRFAENAPYDRIATDLIAGAGLSATSGQVNFILHNSADPAIKTSRLFLGIRLDCAKCHDHPFDRWTQKDFEDMERFFVPLRHENVGGGNVRVSDQADRASGAKPRFLTGARPVTTRWREEYAFFVTRSKPFSRAVANRLWYHFMGRGIVDPPDDFTIKNRPSVPALLDHLAAEAERTNWDLRAMIRLICASDAYRRSSRRGSPDPKAEATFACRVLKPLMAEQVFDSLVSALDAAKFKDRRGAFLKSFVGRSFGEDFTNAWRYRETVQDVMTKLALDLEPPSNSVEEIYLRILSRRPTPRERDLCKGRAPADVANALANSNEFFFNH